MLQVNVKQLQFDDGKMIKASKYGQAEEDVDIEFTEEEQQMAEKIMVSVLSLKYTIVYCTFVPHVKSFDE